LFLREVERDLFVCELVVNSSIGVSPSLNISLVLAVKVYLYDPPAVNLASGPLSYNLGRVDNVLEDGVLYSCESARTRTGSGGLITAGVALSKDGALFDNNNVLAGELLLELTYKSLLDLVECFKKFVWDVNNNCLASSSAVNLLGGSDVKITECPLELGGGHLQIEELLCYGGLELIRLLWKDQTKSK